MKKIELFGSPILRSENQRIEKFDDNLRNTISEMKKLMYKQRGIGLAAPQAGVNGLLFITHAPDDELRIFINPRIISVSVEEIELEEGCLSIPGIYGDVRRPKKVVVEAFDLDGQPFKIKANGMLARVIQHEYDHLKGVLFTDYLDERIQKKAELKFLGKKGKIKKEQKEKNL